MRKKKRVPCACGGCRQCRFGYHCGPCSAAFRERKAALRKLSNLPPWPDGPITPDVLRQRYEAMGGTGDE